MRWAMLLVAVVAAAPALAQEGAFPDGATNPFGHLPLRIRLDFSNLTADDAGFADEVHTALRYWESGGNGRLAWRPSFVETNDTRDADIVFWFRDEGRVGPLCEEAPGALGCARPFERPVPIEVIARREDGTFVPFRLVREVSEHEIGHALGFAHSSIPGDIMAPHASFAAQTAWRPGDLARLVAGGALVLLVIAGLAFAGWRALRPRDDVGQVHLLTLAEFDGPCAIDRRGHRFRDADILVSGEAQHWLVCEHCRGGRPDEENT